MQRLEKPNLTRLYCNTESSTQTFRVMLKKKKKEKSIKIFARLDDRKGSINPIIPNFRTILPNQEIIVG